MSFGEFLTTGSNNTRFLLHLNGNSTDSSGNGLNGTDTSMSYSKIYGKFNEGAYFNGSGQIRLGNSTIMQPTELTISMWIKRTTTAGTTPTLIMRDNGLSSYVSAYCVYLTTTTGYIRYEQQNGGTTVAVQSSVGITDTTTWHHICVVRWPSQGMTRIYLDGKMVAEDLGNYTAIYYSDRAGQGTNIGAYIYGNGSVLARYTGYMDEIILLGIPWSHDDVRKYYTYSRGYF